MMVVVVMIVVMIAMNDTAVVNDNCYDNDDFVITQFLTIADGNNDCRDEVGGYFLTCMRIMYLNSQVIVLCLRQNTITT
jgi:hypothetical protein